ncbi:multidrug efflux SMR transporter [Brevibacillus borstelensis]|uniref:DMT family transporter n=1 Tax=Brevibacillus borstelensis TaxID=45462 RepID=UPI001C12268A|nr:multidrug efflux SMR transporter [Brevibacillus borstelensis]MED1851648.1 multidrug efflux SMR transporter [Brevibacillus borstelensis]
MLFYIQVEGASLADIAAEVGIKKLSIYNHFKGLSAVAGGIMFSFICLTFSMRSLPMGTAYAIWTGIGTVGGALVGMLFFGESKEWRRILFMAMVLAAAIGLKLIS